MKRLMIYFFFDKDGIVDAYVPYFLNKFKPYCEEICTVVNGSITDASKRKLKGYSSVVLERENIGFDSGAFKQAIEYYGFEKLKEYDELIVANFTMFGPIFSPKEIFDKMENSKCDFWGITKAPATNTVFANTKVNEHIQSNFLVYRKKLLSSNDFKEYWDTLRTATSYEEAIAFHELRTTKFFEERGYKSDSYISLEKYLPEIKDKIYYYPILQQIKEDRMPFIKRKIFFCEGKHFQYKIKNGVTELLSYLETKTDYNLDLIIENIKRCNFVKINKFYAKYHYYRCKLLKYTSSRKKNYYKDRELEYNDYLNLIKLIENFNKN